MINRFHNRLSTYRGVNTRLAWCLDSVLNVKAALKQEKALEGAFSVIVQLHRLIGYSSNNVRFDSGQIRVGIKAAHDTHC